MKKIMMSAVAASALMLGGCGETAPEPEATATAEASAEASAEATADADAATATDAGDETTSGGIKPNSGQ